MFTLIIEDKDGAIADEYSFEEGEFIVGRSHSSDIILPSDNVSRRHARLYTQDGKCFIEDLNSSNGVFVNGKRIHRVFEIVRSAQIKVGDYYLHVEGTGYASAEAEPARHVEVQQGKQAAADMGASIQGEGGDAIYGRLIGTNLSTQGRPFDIMKPVNLVGRGKDCAVTIVDPSVSRIHAKVLKAPDGSLRVEDLKSSNGTYVNNERVDNGPFGHGDRVRFGNVEFVCELPGMGEAAEVVEVSTGGRKFALFLVIFLALAFIGGGVWLWLYLHSNQEASEANAQTAAEMEKEKTAEKEKKEAEFKKAKKRIEGIIKAAENLASQDNWVAAVKKLQSGKDALDDIDKKKLDPKGEIAAWFSTAESDLREAHKDLGTIADAMDEHDYDKAGAAYASLLKRSGLAEMKKLAKGKVGPVKDNLVAVAEGLCAEKTYDKCLDYYQKAMQLDPGDKEVATTYARIRIKAAAAKKELEQAPTPPPEPPKP